MSEIRSIPIPIKMKYSKSWHAFSDPYNQIQNYLFELNIKMNDDESKQFIKLESDKHCNLIIVKDQIKFKNTVDNYLSAIQFKYVNTSFISKSAG